MRAFQDVQGTYQSKSRSQLQRQYKIVRPYASPAELSAFSDATGSMTLTSSQIFQLGSETDPRAVLQQMRARRTSVMNIEKGLKDLGEMFVQMQTVVFEQQDLLDKIENYMEMAEEFIVEANTHMETAVEHQKNIYKLKFCSIF